MLCSGLKFSTSVYLVSSCAYIFKSNYSHLTHRTFTLVPKTHTDPKQNLQNTAVKSAYDSSNRIRGMGRDVWERHTVGLNPVRCYLGFLVLTLRSAPKSSHFIATIEMKDIRISKYQKEK